MKDFICEECKTPTTGFNNQRFCLGCKDENNTNKKRATDKRYYEENKRELTRKQRKYWKKNYIPHPKKLLTQEEKKIKQRAYFERSREHRRKVSKIYRLHNREEINKKGREYYHSNPEIAIVARKRNLPNRRKNNPAYIKNKMLTDPQFNIRAKLRGRFYSAMKTYTKSGKIMKSKGYGIDYKKIIEHLKPFPKDLSKYHIDHIKPLCSFDLTNPEEIKKAFAPENHQWLTAHENLSKGKKII